MAKDPKVQVSLSVCSRQREPLLGTTGQADSVPALGYSSYPEGQGSPSPHCPLVEGKADGFQMGEAAWEGELVPACRQAPPLPAPQVFVFDSTDPPCCLETWAFCYRLGLALSSRPRQGSGDHGLSLPREGTSLCSK